MVHLHPQRQRPRLPLPMDWKRRGQQHATYLMSIKKSFCRIRRGEGIVPPLPVDLVELKQSITTAIDGLNLDTLTCVSTEICGLSAQCVPCD
ncbi:hypothetical protein TNCV_2306601 [Trichonephila clavipes]|nr:hypothetical protein TNCV_2306601 [Trichonephila clavipes]